MPGYRAKDAWGGRLRKAGCQLQAVGLDSVRRGEANRRHGDVEGKETFGKYLQIIQLSV